MVVLVAMMKNFNILCRKLQLVVTKHCIYLYRYKYKAENSTPHYIVEYIQHTVH